MKLEKVIAVRNSKTVYHDGEYAVKVFDDNYSKSDILNEALNLAYIEETKLNVPQVVEITKVNNKWAIVTRFIEGKTLERLIIEHPEKYNEYIELFVDIQLNIHSKKSPLLNKLKDKMDAKISIADLDATSRYDLHSRLEAMPKHNKVCHGDFNFSNIIIDKNGTPYIIDWSHATQGNASADVARTYLLFCLANDITGADLYLKLFCEKSGVEKQYIQKWLPIVAASQLVKGNPKEREFLMHWINVVDYE